jgi:hypothetical protein
VALELFHSPKSLRQNEQLGGDDPVLLVHKC